MTSEMTEKQLQDLMIQFLSYQPKTFVWRQNQGAMYTNEGGQRHGFKATSIQGVSDILGIWKGKPIAIEVKRPGKKPTEYQRGFLKQFANAGGLAICACTQQGLEKTLKEIEAMTEPFKGMYVVEVP